jgi:hypothetical protein
MGIVVVGPESPDVRQELYTSRAGIPRTSDAPVLRAYFAFGQMATLLEPELSLVLPAGTAAVSFRVCVSDPQAADDLVAFFAWARCPAERIFEGEVAVVLEDAAETPTELEFALAAWRRRFPDVTVEIRQAA